MINSYRNDLRASCEEAVSHLVSSKLIVHNIFATFVFSFDNEIPCSQQRDQE
jgi:hypothetical protein